MKLKDIRNKINLIDKEMAKLFEERMKLSHEVAIFKIKNGLAIEDKVRENQLIKQNSSYIESDEIKEYYIDFLNDLMTTSKKYQKRIVQGMNVAYCGVEGAFAHIASKKVFDSQNLVSYPSFNQAYQAVVDGKADACLLPIENSFAGDVGEVLDLIFSGPLYINNVIDVEITHNLLAKKGTNIKNIKKVISHPQALSQCNSYILEKGFEKVESSNTAIAAYELSQSDDDSVAVIASKEVASLYDLEILQANINESRNNTTRFAVFSKVLNKRKVINKMGEHFILVFTVLNEAGALAKTLNIIGAHNFNMRTLRSRPMKELLWNYYFFVEADGDINSSDGQDMIKELSSVCDRLKVVGTYYSYIEK